MSDDWVKPIQPWTWSDYEAYSVCPKQFYELKFRPTQFKEIPHETSQWGWDVHDAIDMHVKTGMPLVGRMAQFQPLITQILKAPGHKESELKIAVDQNLKDTDYKDPNAWTRGKDDLVIVNGSKALSIDWKLGKKKAFSRQLELSACRLFAHFPEVHTVHTAFSWLATKEWTPATYTRDQLNKLWEGFFGTVEQMLWSYENNVWPAKPSGLCSKSKKPGSTYQGCPVANCPHSQFYRK